MDKPPREAQRIDREAVKTLAIAVGVREAARRLNLNENTVISWSKRDNWFAEAQPPKPPGQPRNQSAIKPSDALRTAMEEDSRETKIGFSRAARKVAAHLQESPVEHLTKPGTAIAAKSWHGIAESVHGWREADPGSSPLNLQVLSNQTVISIGSDRTSAD